MRYALFQLPFIVAFVVFVSVFGKDSNNQTAIDYIVLGGVGILYGFLVFVFWIVFFTYRSKHHTRRMLKASYWRKARVKDVRASLGWGADADVPDEEGFISLHWAIKHSPNPSAVECLLKRYSNLVYQCSNDGFTPLHLAVLFSRKPEMIELLLEYGASVSMQEKDKHGKRPFDYIKNSPALKGTKVYKRLKKEHTEYMEISGWWLDEKE